MAERKQIHTSVTLITIPTWLYFSLAHETGEFPLQYTKLPCSGFSLLSYSAFQHLSAAATYRQQIPNNRKPKYNVPVSQNSPTVNTLTNAFFK